MNKQVAIFVIVILIFFFLFLTYRDQRVIEKLPMYNDLPEEKRAQFFGCFPFREETFWKPIVLASLIAAFTIWLILYEWNIHLEENILLAALIFVTIFFVFYLLQAYRAYHFYRILCSKIDENVITIY